MPSAWNSRTHWGPPAGSPVMGWDGRVHRFDRWKGIAVQTFCNKQMDNRADGVPGVVTVSFVNHYNEAEKCSWCWKVCIFCRHTHTEKPWSDRDKDDGTCWDTSGPLVCGCPKKVMEYDG